MQKSCVKKNANIIKGTLNLDLFEVPGVDWLVESNKGVFSDLAKLVVERFDRGVPVLRQQN